MTDAAARADADYSHHVPETATEIDAPLTVADPDAFAWDDECDMLVVGYGLAGASAALKGAELGGMDIILADRFMGGGTSALSGGVVYAGGGTRVQKQFGIADSTEGLAAYLMHEVGGIRRPDTVRRFAEASPHMIDWLEARGPHFDGPVAKKKTSYPPANEFLYYSGNEKVPSHGTAFPPAPRGHRARSNDPRDDKSFSGAVLMNALKRTIADTPAIRTRFQASARRLIVDGEGRVIGAELWQIPQGGSASRWHTRYYDLSKRVMFTILGLTAPIWRLVKRVERRAARPLRVRARRGVVLSTGGFANNRSMVDAAAPVYAKTRPAGTIADDGSAIRLGQSVGAGLGQMHLLSCWRFISPPSNWMKGMVVSGAGERIVNEEMYGANLGGAIFEKGAGHAWLIVDAPIQEAAVGELDHDPLWAYQKLPAKAAVKAAKKGATLAELEAQLPMPKGALTARVAEHNSALATASPDPVGKSDEFRVPIETGPFYAMDLSWNARMNPIGAITLGGLDVDEDSGGVRDRAGGQIPGLFAAGRSAVGICSGNYISGLSLADCVWSGWVAAESIAGNRPPA